jgi:hypothetical protein
MKKIIYLNLSLILLILVTFFFWYQSLKDDSTLILKNYSESDTSFHFPIVPIYLQKDSRWKDDKIGGSLETLGSVGCFVCCVSMALAHYGIDLNPKQLNELLKENEGYTSQGWVKWTSVAKITNHQVNFYVPHSPRFSLIDAALKASEPVLAKIKLYGLISHWILIVGKEGSDYLVKDPLGSGESLKKLSTFKSKIYAIRIVKKEIIK